MSYVDPDDVQPLTAPERASKRVLDLLQAGASREEVAGELVRGRWQVPIVIDGQAVMVLAEDDYARSFVDYVDDAWRRDNRKRGVGWIVKGILIILFFWGAAVVFAIVAEMTEDMGTAMLVGIGIGAVLGGLEFIIWGLLKWIGHLGTSESGVVRLKRKMTRGVVGLFDAINGSKRLD